MKLACPLIFLAALGSAMSALACDAPAEINIPPGDEATLDEMLAAQTGVREFIAAMEEYLACMDGEIEALAEDTPEEDRTMSRTVQHGVNRWKKSAPISTNHVKSSGRAVGRGLTAATPSSLHREARSGHAPSRVNSRARSGAAPCRASLGRPCQPPARSTSSDRCLAEITLLAC